VTSSSSRFVWPWALSIFAILAILLLFPLNDDNGAWQSIAIDWVHFGKWPYLGAWDQSFPGVLLFHIPAVAIFGPSGIGFRLLDLFVQIAFCFFLYRLWRLWLREETVWLAILFYVCYYVRSAPFVAGERDLYGALLILLASYPFLKAESAAIEVSHKTILTSGLIAGVAVLIRPTFILYVLALVVILPSLRTVKRSILIGCAALFPLLLSYVLFASKAGALREYWLATYQFNIDVYSSIARPFKTFWRSLTSPGLLTLPFAISVLLLATKWQPIPERSPSRRTLYLYISFIAITLALILWMHKYYLYHYAMVDILLTPIAALGLEAILSRIPRSFRWTIAVLVLGFFAMPREMLLRSYRHGDFSRSFKHGIQTSFNASVNLDSTFGQTMNFFNGPERKQSSVEVCSFDPRLRAALDREPATPYSSLHPIGFRLIRSDMHSFTAYQREWRKAYLDSLAMRRPAYLVIQRGTVAEYLRDPYNDVLHYLEGFDSLLTSNYRLDTIIGRNQIYRLK
jgi:hypothetical protein